MRKFTVLVACMMFSLPPCYATDLVTSTLILYGNSWGFGFSYAGLYDYANFWTTYPYFEKVTGLPAGWSYYLNSPGDFLQILTPGAATTSPIEIFWNDPETDVYFHYQFIYGGNVVVQGTLFHQKGSNSWAHQPSYSGPGNVPGPVPEPSSIFLFGLASVAILTLNTLLRTKKLKF